MLEAAISESVTLKNKEDREASFDSLTELSSVLKNRKPSPFWTEIKKESTTIFANIDVECGHVIKSSVVICSHTEDLWKYRLPMAIKNTIDLFIVLDEFQSLKTTQ
ncbi:hypothetical protein PR048_000025 [Dryococelus australis]|uniref:Uncharacterized protein n=1 Tax=Dryococelus australis TaxID=614101 RepID=A0ABQ9IDH0_9NEOP|nr:hypothetical protein PR048_000025 [Dryococelus australis]